MARMTEKAKRALGKIVQKMKDGNLGPIVSLTQDRFKGGDKPSLHWSISNRFLAYLGTGSMDCRGFRQWKEVDRYPSGKATAWILYPRIKTITRSDGTEEEEFHGFGTSAVWGYNQTEGKELYDESELVPSEPPPLADIAKTAGIKVKYMPLPPSTLGSAKVDGSSIKLGTQDPSVWFHEFGHAIHARVVDGLDMNMYGENEVVAELTAATLMDYYGYRDHSGNAWEYIKRYADDPLQAIQRAASDVGKIIDFTLRQAGGKSG